MENLEKREKLIAALYSDREKYTIVALTGYTGTGCSSLANLMSTPFKQWNDLRLPNDLTIPKPQTVDNEELMQKGLNNHKSIGNTIFARKYTLCYNFASNHYEKFKILKYSHALIFYTLNYIINTALAGETVAEDKKLKLHSNLESILKDKFRPSRDRKDDNYRQKRICQDYPLPPSFSYDSENTVDYKWMKAHKIINFEFNDWDKLINAFESIPKGDFKAQAELFFGENGIDVFTTFFEKFNSYLWEIDPYCTNFFYHRLGFTIRATGNPMEKAHNVIHSGKLYGEHLYCIVELINHLIKGLKNLLNPHEDQQEKDKPEKENQEEVNATKERKACRVAIDKIRNSLEAKYLKERYSAFYLVATHEEKAVENHLRKRINRIYDSQEEIDKNKELIELQIKKILSLDSIEREGKDFDSGKFFAQNLSQCLADAEIHISNEDGQGEDRPYFYSMSEQWMKFASLIQHPGLITPSSEERCMVVAYTAKFNSGCISRQVGAVITNKAHTIRTIGWNDVPYGQVPCSLRELPVMATGDGDCLKIWKYAYSDYETGDVKRFNDGLTFNDKVRIKYRTLHRGLPENELMVGMPYPYCFKGLQNEFDGEKNQVHIRSLHAEENAILQMAKYGGEALYEGIIYVTASPCELCCKKLYQIGVRKIVYIDEYPGISRPNLIAIGYNRPKLKQFQGAYGSTYFKLYQPIIAYKEELSIRLGNFPKANYRDKNKDIIIKYIEEQGIDLKTSALSSEDIKEMLQGMLQNQDEKNKYKNE